jgi:lipid II:glycine glycyltransferase (peptidoglycan interpeptide bridge formation enzyme)
VPGFRRQPKYTPLIMLRKTEDEIFAAFGKNTKHKIKRALTEGMVFSVETSMDVLERAAQR